MAFFLVEAKVDNPIWLKLKSMTFFGLKLKPMTFFWLKLKLMVVMFHVVVCMWFSSIQGTLYVCM